MNARKILLALCIGLGSVVTIGATPALARADIYVQIGPPPVQYEAVPVLEPGWVWQAGYWEWTGHKYVWVHGRRVHAHRGYHWVPYTWAENSGHWHRDGGRWDRD